jgi:hypothetical protein
LGHGCEYPGRRRVEAMRGHGFLLGARGIR